MWTNLVYAGVSEAIMETPQLRHEDTTPVLQPQSGDLMHMNKSSMKVQNVTFKDDQAGYTATMAGTPDVTRSITDTYDTDLASFFRRPIKIADITWSVSTNISSYYNPWNLYFSNPRVENRLTTFNLIRARLHLKFVVNGQPFLFSRALACYGPFDTLDDFGSTASISDLVTWSQRPKVFLNPTLSQGGEMVIPWHYYRNNASIQEGVWATEMGALWVRSLDILRNASDVAGAANIAIFAWAEDVVVSGLTSLDLATLTPQSGEIEEANKEGVVSGPATAVAKLAGKLSGIPTIGPYATATSYAAGLVAEVAAAMGYCRPPVTKNPDPYKPSAVSSLAVTNVPDGTQKLTVDHKQELTIDPTVCGVGEHDLLNIKSIAQRETYLTSFLWSESSPTETRLFNIRVDPVQWLEDTGAFYFTASAVAAMPFKYWTGTFKVRFQIMASAYHKGRLRITYDPNEISTNEYNTNYVRIVDLSEETDVTLEYGVGQPDTLMMHAEPGVTVSSAMYGSTKISRSLTFGNGVVDVSVLTPLVKPAAGSSTVMKVNVFVSMGDDFEVFVPTSDFQQFVLRPQSGILDPQSGTIDPSKVTAPSGIDEPENTQSSPAGVVSYAPAPTNLVFTGESITSFRTLLKRYNRFTAIGPTDYITTRVSIRMNMFPYLRGNVAGAVDSRAGPAQYNFCNTILLHWITYCFAGWRGSIRWKAMPHYFASNTISIVSRHNADAGKGGYSYSSTPIPNWTTKRQIAAANVYEAADSDTTDSGPEGVAYTLAQVNPVLEWEMPYYSQRRFYPGKLENVTQGNDHLDYYNLRVTSTNENTLDYTNATTIWVAAGEDFQTYFWTGLPPMYYEPTPPPAL